MSEQQPQQPAGGGTRKFLLVVVLAILVAALGYDYGIARPAVSSAYQKVMDRSAEVNRDGTSRLTNLDVQQLIGKEPSESFSDPRGDWIEKYTWRAGLPLRTHDLYAVYTPQSDGSYLFKRHAQGSLDDADARAIDRSKPYVIEMTETPPDPMEAAGGGGGFGGGGGGGGFGGGGGGGGRNFGPEARFAESDADGDGLLKGDEISERMQENLAEIDTDGDGAVSLEEMTARFEAMRARFGGGGRPGGGGGGRGDGDRPQRPELDSDDGEETGESEEAAATEDADTGSGDDKSEEAETEESGS